MIHYVTFKIVWIHLSAIILESDLNALCVVFILFTVLSLLYVLSIDD